MWDLESGVVVRTLEGHSDYVNAVAMMADSKRAVSASQDKTLKVWNLDSGAPLVTFTCDGASYSCAFIDDHKLIAGDACGHVYFLKFEQSNREK